MTGPDTYIMGIIDFQQQWNLNKKVCTIPMNSTSTYSTTAHYNIILHVMCCLLLDGTVFQSADQRRGCIWTLCYSSRYL